MESGNLKIALRLVVKKKKTTFPYGMSTGLIKFPLFYQQVENIEAWKLNAGPVPAPKIKDYT